MNNVHSELLDAEFRQILYIIKPHINHIDDHYQLDRYRIWLERLSTVHNSEKLERNKYLLELANQIHDNRLRPPFTLNPPNDFLPPLKVYQKNTVPDPELIIEPYYDAEVGAGQWPYLSPRRTPQIEEKATKRHGSSRDLTHQKKKISKPKVPIRPFQKLGRSIDSTRGKSDTSSWCDLTDTTSATQMGEDGHKIQSGVTSQHKEEAQKAQEHFIKQYEEEKKKYSTGSSSFENKKKLSIGSGSFDVNEFLAKEDRNSKPTEQEVEALKMRMKDLLEVKNALRDTHCLTEDRKKTIEALKTKLAFVEQQKVELQTRLDEQEKKFMELDKLKIKELNDFKEKFSVLRQKEVDYLKQYHKDEVISLQKIHNIKTAEIQSKLDRLKRDYEDKLKKLTDSNMNLMKRKEEEIQELQSQLKMKISHPPGEGNSVEQIDILKRCISKLDKVLHRNEKDYQKKIEKLKQDLDVKDTTNQVQLQTQRADLIVRHAATKQEELRSALNSLEGKYKKMMETLQSHALDAKRHDDKLIEELKGLLHKNNIVF